MTAVMSFYRFVPLTDLEPLRRELEHAATELRLKGTILLAAEGINGSLAGTPPALERFRDGLRRIAAFADMACRFSGAAPGNPVFGRLKVRVKPEIVRLDQGPVAPHRRTGERVDAAGWNRLLDDPNVLVLDTRNRHEIALGAFPGARDPGTRSFRQFPAFVRGHLSPERDRRIAMYCTGGIRCEKASAWLLAQGFDAVHQLDGGILEYLEAVAPEDNRWQGECFVFDQRLSLTAASVARRPPAPDR